MVVNSIVYTFTSNTIPDATTGVPTATFTPIPGVTEYTFEVIGGSGGNGNTSVGGRGSKINMTYTGITEALTIKLGGAGARGSARYLNNDGLFVEFVCLLFDSLRGSGSKKKYLQLRVHCFDCLLSFF